MGAIPSIVRAIQSPINWAPNPYQGVPVVNTRYLEWREGAGHLFVIVQVDHPKWANGRK